MSAKTTAAKRASNSVQGRAPCAATIPAIAVAAAPSRNCAEPSKAAACPVPRLGAAIARPISAGSVSPMPNATATIAARNPANGAFATTKTAAPREPASAIVPPARASRTDPNRAARRCTAKVANIMATPHAPKANPKALGVRPNAPW